MFQVRYFQIIILCSFLNLFPALGSCADSIPPYPPTGAYQSKSVRKIINTLIDNGGFIFRTDTNKIIEHNRYSLFTPASILKIATASAAFEILGPQHRFKTTFYQDHNNDVYIKGYGDPFLTSEELSLIWSSLAKLNLRPFEHLYIDNSYFNLESPTADGAKGSNNPFDALNSSLSVNFNALPIKITKDSVLSLEPQTPFIPLMNKYASGLTQGKHRIAISENIRDISTYAGQLFVCLTPLDMPKQLLIEEKIVPFGLEPLYEHHSSKSLQEIISSLLLYSNNFIANQLFLSVGAKMYGSPATWEKGKNALELFLLNNLRIKKEQFAIKEGSGLSRKNKLSPDAMIRILENFKPYSNLLPQDRSLFIKSGTLNGVYSYAGYIISDISTSPFVIILNQKKNTRDVILKELLKTRRP